VYFDRIDAMCHEYGPESIQVHAEIDMFLTAMERWFMPFAAGKLKNTLLVVTADHGHMAVSPQTTVYLNTDPRLKGLLGLLRKDRRGVILPPGGSPRDVFLYVEPEFLDEARTLVAEALAGHSDVVKTGDLLAGGYFGPPPFSDALLARLGNLVVLPYENESAWWYEKDRFEQGYYGHHGGLSRAEMEIPLGLLDLSP
jgi:predicted AlkP superfamily pyrophosphatase or phosphodiesterase